MVSTEAYHVRCISDMPMSSLISRLAGRSFSTSALRRRSRKGRRILCSWLRTSSGFDSASASRLNQSSNWSDESKMSGRR